jgi:predicted nucleic acid-binding protein
LLNEGHHFSTTALNIAEVYAGVRPEESELMAALLDSLECHELTARSGEQAGLLKNDWARKGRTLSSADAIIAAMQLRRSAAS